MCHLLGTSQNKEMFDTFWNTAYHLFVTQTTANYPDVMMPIFKKNRYAILFFVAFLVINYFLLFNMVIAIFYYNFKTELQSTLKQIVKNKSLALYITTIASSKSYYRVITQILESESAATKNIEQDLIVRGVADVK